tara:strand:- start:662 stop:1174 length:513 start_codon:yes stop_codon:yes gene_type:complete
MALVPVFNTSDLVKLKASLRKVTFTGAARTALTVASKATRKRLKAETKGTSQFYSSDELSRSWRQLRLNDGKNRSVKIYAHGVDSRGTLNWKKMLWLEFGTREAIYSKSGKSMPVRITRAGYANPKNAKLGRDYVRAYRVKGQKPKRILARVRRDVIGIMLSALDKNLKI